MLFPLAPISLTVLGASVLLSRAFLIKHVQLFTQ